NLAGIHNKREELLLPFLLKFIGIRVCRPCLSAALPLGRQLPVHWVRPVVLCCGNFFHLKFVARLQPACGWCWCFSGFGSVGAMAWWLPVFCHLSPRYSASVSNCLLMNLRPARCF